MRCIKAERKECTLSGCYHYRRHLKDKSCDGNNRCDNTTPCVTDNTHFSKTNQQKDETIIKKVLDNHFKD